MADGEGTHGKRPLAEDAAVVYRTFLAIGGLVAILAIIYWFTAYEDAGTTMLTLTAVLATWVGIYLWLRRRHVQTIAPEPEPGASPTTAVPAPTDKDVEAADTAAVYLPHASLWPFAIGLGAAIAVNGFVLGLWILAPGAILTAIGTGGFVRQSRHRT